MKQLSAKKAQIQSHRSHQVRGERAEFSSCLSSSSSVLCFSLSQSLGFKQTRQRRTRERANHSRGDDSPTMWKTPTQAFI